MPIILTQLHAQSSNESHNIIYLNSICYLSMEQSMQKESTCSTRHLHRFEYTF